MQVLCDDSRPPLPEPPYLSLAGRNIPRNFYHRSREHCYSPPHSFTCSYVFLSVYFSMTLCLLRFCLSLFMLSLSLGLFFSLSVSFCLCHPHHYQCPAGQGNWWPLRSTHVPIRQVRSFLLRRSIGYSSPRAPPRAKNILICFQSSFGKLRLHLPFQRLLTYRPSPSLYTCRHPISPSALGHGQCRCTLLSAWKPLPPYSPPTAPCGISWTLMGLLLRHSGQ